MATYMRRRYRAPRVPTGARDELELYGEVELQRGPIGVWWYGRWYSWVLPAGVSGGVRVDADDLEEIRYAEFELARTQRWVLGPSAEGEDDEADPGRSEAVPGPAPDES
jgi:hypothetical protein